MRHSLNAVDYSNLIQNILLSISLIAGGIWAWYKFRRRNEVASLSVKIEKATLLKDVDSLFFISTEVVISNIGNREVNLYYNFVPKDDTKSKFEVVDKHYEAGINLFKVDRENLIPISKKKGLSSATMHHKGRLRSSVSIRLPYILPVYEPGLYLLEFSIQINMQTYFKAEDNNDNPIKIWSDRIYFNITKKDLKSKKQRNLTRSIK